MVNWWRDWSSTSIIDIFDYCFHRLRPWILSHVLRAVASNSTSYPSNFVMLPVQASCASFSALTKILLMLYDKIMTAKTSLDKHLEDH